MIAFHTQLLFEKMFNNTIQELLFTVMDYFLFDYELIDNVYCFSQDGFRILKISI